jgi:hypothetical protein
VSSAGGRSRSSVMASRPVRSEAFLIRRYIGWRNRHARIECCVRSSSAQRYLTLTRTPQRPPAVSESRCYTYAHPPATCAALSRAHTQYPRNSLPEAQPTYRSNMTSGLLHRRSRYGAPPLIQGSVLGRALLPWTQDVRVALPSGSEHRKLRGVTATLTRRSSPWMSRRTESGRGHSLCRPIR